MAKGFGLRTCNLGSPLDKVTSRLPFYFPCLSFTQRLCDSNFYVTLDSIVCPRTQHLVTSRFMLERTVARFTVPNRTFRYLFCVLN